MEQRELITIMKTVNQLKDTMRHSWTKAGRRESVAEHTFSLCAAAFLLKHEFSDLDMNKVLYMCLFHDIGEAFTGDIPAFWKNDNDETVEADAVHAWIDTLPNDIKEDLRFLFDEMAKQESKEAKLYKALDKMDALLMHNEADIATWLPLEYELNLTYGEKQVEHDAYLRKYRETLNEDTLLKIKEKQEKDRKNGKD